MFIKTNFKIELKEDFSGLNFFIKSKSPNSRCFFLFQYKLYRKITTRIGRIKSKYKYFFSSNSYIEFKVLGFRFYTKTKYDMLILILNKTFENGFS